MSTMASTKPPPAHFSVLYFAAAISYTKKQQDFLPSPLPIEKLFDALEERYAGMKEQVLKSCAVTVNLEYIDFEEEAGKGEEGMVVKEGDEVGIIPPVSSG